jgi:hypothetical protein
MMVEWNKIVEPPSSLVPMPNPCKVLPTEITIEARYEPRLPQVGDLWDHAVYGPRSVRLESIIELENGEAEYTFVVLPPDKKGRR